MRDGLTSLLIGALLATAIAGPAEGAEVLDGITAAFDGEELVLSESWEGAEACHVGEGLAARCFRTEADMDAWLEQQGLIAGRMAEMATSSCNGYLRLYDGVNYTGTVLHLATRGHWLNLSSYGFDQRTSSYKVGPCGSTFADHANGGGAHYPTSLTQAHDQAPTMLTGWNNDVSSVRIS